MFSGWLAYFTECRGTTGLQTDVDCLSTPIPCRQGRLQVLVGMCLFDDADKYDILRTLFHGSEEFEHTGFSGARWLTEKYWFDSRLTLPKIP